MQSALKRDGFSGFCQGHFAQSDAKTAAADKSAAPAAHAAAFTFSDPDSDRRKGRKGPGGIRRLAILFAERRDQKVISVLEDACAKGE